MTYTPTEWKNGDTITAEKLNNMEQGIVDASGGSGGGVLLIGVDSDTQIFDKTYKEIKDAYDSGKNCSLELNGTYSSAPYTAYASIFTFIETTAGDDPIYAVGFTNTISGNFSTAFTDSENGYPHISEE